MGKLKLIRNFDPEEMNRKGWFDMYDLSQDVSKTTNVANKKRYRHARRKMQAMMKELGPCPTTTQPDKFILSNDNKKGEQRGCN